MARIQLSLKQQRKKRHETKKKIIVDRTKKFGFGENTQKCKPPQFTRNLKLNVLKKSMFIKGYEKNISYTIK